jgi:hypothetical protein
MVPENIFSAKPTKNIIVIKILRQRIGESLDIFYIKIMKKFSIILLGLLLTLLCSCGSTSGGDEDSDGFDPDLQGTWDSDSKDENGKRARVEIESSSIKITGDIKHFTLRGCAEGNWLGGYSKESFIYITCGAEHKVKYRISKTKGASEYDVLALLEDTIESEYVEAQYFTKF